jgi:hypothetical protein
MAYFWYGSYYLSVIWKSQQKSGNVYFTYIYVDE